MTGFTMKVEGLRELEQALKKLREEMAGRKEENIVANALRKSSKETMLAPMQAYIRPFSKTSRLHYGLDVKRHPRPSGWTELFGVGVHKLGRRPENEKEGEKTHLPWYAAIVEYGGKGKKSQHKGWMRRIAENNSRQFVEVFREDAAKRIEKAAKKIGSENLRQVAGRIRSL